MGIDSGLTPFTQGAIYLEGQARAPIPVIAAGWSVEPETGRNGPQFTFSLLGMNWLRINANIDGSYAILYGVTLRVINEWVWSR